MLLPFVMLAIHGLLSRDDAMLFAVAVNLLALLSAIVLIQEGLRRGLSQFFYSGIALVLALAVMRYLDLFGDYLGAAAMFLVAAAVLYGAAVDLLAELAEAPVAADWKPLDGVVRHTFTHFHLELMVLAGQVRAGAGGGEWCLPSRFSEHALPTLMKKVARHVAGALAK